MRFEVKVKLAVVVVMTALAVLLALAWFAVEEHRREAERIERLLDTVEEEMEWMRI